MTETQIQKAIDRELFFFLRFYMAYDQSRARKLDELVTLIGMSRANRLPFRYQELFDQIQKVIETNADEYQFSAPFVWLNTFQDALKPESTSSFSNESVSAIESAPAKESAVTLEIPSTWPSPDYQASESAFRNTCKAGLEKHREFADEYVQLLGVPSPDKKERAAYSSSSLHLLKLVTSKPHQTKYGLKNKDASFDIVAAGDAMFNLHWAESKRLAGV